MDLNRIALFTVALSSTLALARALRPGRGRQAKGWLAVFAGLLLLAGAAWLVAPGWGGLVAGAVWCLLVLLPSLGSQRLVRAVQRQDYRRARRIAQVLSVLHPADGWREQPEVLRALELAFCGEVEQAAALLSRHRAGGLAVSRVATAQLLRLGGRWEELAAWVERDVGEQGLGDDPSLISSYLRALGETAGPEPLARAYARLEPFFSSPQAAAAADLCRLFLCAFGGRRDLVERLFRGALRSYGDQVKRFWLATADLAAGRPVAALAELEQLRDAPDALVRSGVELRLARSLPALATTLSPASRALLDRLARRLDEEERYGDRPAATASRPWAVHALAGVLAIFFLVELALGGSTDPHTLLRLGAFWPSAILEDGEWWRLVLFTALHFGSLHLLMNVLGLYVLGPFVERTLGVARFLLVYFFAAVGGGGIALLLYVWGLAPERFLVGASGGIMGLVGATAAILLLGWRREKAATASRRLASILVLIAVQATFDLSTPQVSFTAHAAGLVLGFVAALGLRPRFARALR